MKQAPSTSPERVLHLSLAGISIGLLVMLGLGILGALIVQQYLRPPLPPLSADGDRLITTIQEVTISPNMAIAGMVERVQRSVVLLGQRDGEQRTPLGTGFVVTNDGLVMTAASLPAGELTAFDHEGRPLGIERVGTDELFGIAYLRLRDAVIVPLDVQPGDVPVGQALVALSRNQLTYQPRLAAYRLQEYALPPSLSAAGVQRVILGAPVTDELLAGSPLLDEEGRVAAVLQNPSAGIALPVTHLQTSLQRVTTNRRELNPFTVLGFSWRPAFRTLAADGSVQFVGEVTAVEAHSVAATAGLQRGDLITQIGSDALDWQRPLVTSLSQTLPWPLTVNRRGQEITLQVQPAAPAETQSVVPVGPVPSPAASPTR